jgi:hypothetical protein
MANIVVFANIGCTWVFYILTIAYLTQNFYKERVRIILAVFLVAEPFIYLVWYIRLAISQLPVMTISQRLLFPLSILALLTLSTLRLTSNFPNIHRRSFQALLNLDISQGDSKFFNFHHRNGLFWFTQIFIELILTIVPITV